MNPPAAIPAPPTPWWVRGTTRFLVALALMYLVYGRAHMLFFRAESGWLLIEKQRGWAGLLDWTRFVLTTSYSGHYTPLFFVPEILWTFVCGTSEAWWRLRQMAAMAVVALGLWSFFGEVAARVSAHRVVRFWLAAVPSALFLFSPVVIELVEWPFMAAQLLWAALTLLSMSWLGRAAAGAGDGEVPLRPLGISLAFAYASVNIFGLGLATMAGWCAAWAVLWLEAWQRKTAAASLRRLGRLGLVGAGLMIFHAALMILLLGKPLSAGARAAAAEQAAAAAHGPGPWRLAGEGLGYVACFVQAVLRTVWSPDDWAGPRTDLLAHEWPYGLGLILLLAVCGVCWYRACRAERSAASLCRVCWHVFSLAGFAVFTLLVVLRIHRGDGTWLNYLVGPRYLWTGAVLLAGFVASFALGLRVRDPLLAAAAGAVLVAASVAGSVVYQRQVAPRVWPYSAVSHEAVWQQCVRMAGELHAADLPLPDFRLKQALGCLDFSLQPFQPGLRRAAGLGRSATLGWRELDAISPALWRRMLQRSPALATLARTVFADEAAAMPPPVGPAHWRLTNPDVLQAARLDHVKDHPNLGVDITVDGVSRRTVWIDAPTAITFRQVLLGAHPVFQAFVAIHPAVWGLGDADGAVFQVDVVAHGEAVRVAETAVDPFAHPEQKTWTAVTADLSRFAGQQVDLVLSNDPGPAGNDYADWCLWGDPELIEQ